MYTTMQYLSDTEMLDHNDHMLNAYLDEEREAAVEHANAQHEMHIEDLLESKAFEDGNVLAPSHVEHGDDDQDKHKPYAQIQGQVDYTDSESEDDVTLVKSETSSSSDIQEVAHTTRSSERQLVISLLKDTHNAHRSLTSQVNRMQRDVDRHIEKSRKAALLNEKHLAMLKARLALKQHDQRIKADQVHLIRYYLRKRPIEVIDLVDDDDVDDHKQVDCKIRLKRDY